METNAKIMICSEMRGEDGAWQRSFYSAAGEAAFEGESWRVEYDEPEQTGMEGVHTVLRLDKDCAELERAGSVRCALRFLNGGCFRIAARPAACWRCIIPCCSAARRTSTACA